MDNPETLSARKRTFSSVRFKMLAFSALVVLLAGGVPSAFSIVQSHRAAQARIDAQLEHVAKLVATGGVSADGRGGIDGRALRGFVNNAPAMRLPVAYVLVEAVDGGVEESLSAVNPEVLQEISRDLAAAWTFEERRREVLEAIASGSGLGSSHRSLVMTLQASGSGAALARLRVGMSTLEADLQTKRAMTSTGLLIGSFLFIALFLSALISGRMTRPIQRLAAAMTQVAEGDLDQDLPPTSSDEVGQLTVAFNAMTAGLRQRERLHTTLGRYVSADVAERILIETDDLALRGEIRMVSVLFLDMRHFTTLAEKLGPHEVVDLLNSYFDIIVSTILRYDGVINKFIGDAIMAVWGAPRTMPDHAWQAVQAAWTIQRLVGTFNWDRMKKRLDVIHVGIGINTGEAIAGNVGTAQRLEYTVIGDEVNLAQRLESMAMPGQVLVSTATHDLVADRVAANKLDEVKVKGRKSLVTPYEITDLIAEESSGRKSGSEVKGG